jgi:hypothetical protein
LVRSKTIDKELAVESVRHDVHRGMDSQSVGHRAPASQRISLAIAAATSIAVAYGAFKSTGVDVRDVMVAAVLPLLLSIGALFDWFVARQVRVRRRVTVLRSVQLPPRPSKVPPSPRIQADRAA